MNLCTEHLLSSFHNPFIPLLSFGVLIKPPISTSKLSAPILHSLHHGRLQTQGQ
jgi:hypothetical protein